MSLDLDPESIAAKSKPALESRGLGSLPTYKDDSVKPKKVFSTPFKLVFKRPKDQALVWLEVKTLDQLTGVATKVSEGTLFPVNEMGTLDRQLWGHLAEYVGFLRLAGVSQFAGGVAPLGAEKAELADDMVELFGGVEPGLRALSVMREKVLADQEARLPCEPTTTHDFVKSDGVNLTKKGEVILAEMVGETAEWDEAADEDLAALEEDLDDSESSPSE